MDEFKNINNTENQSSEISGFDSADKQNETEYPVTSDGGFYNKPKDEIIQDEVIKKSEPQNQVPYENKGETYRDFNTPKTNYYPNGQYGNAYYNNFGGYNTPKARKPKTQKRYGAGVVVLASVLAAVIGALSGIIATVVNSDGNSVTLTPSNIEGSKVNINIDETAESVVEAIAVKVTPSVVGIRTTTSVMSFFGGSSEASGEGSGVVYTQDGYIITNYHVVADAITNKSSGKIEVFFDSASSKSYPATVVGYNISSDLAVIKVNATGLTAIEIADSKKLNVGQYVITVGNPGGLEFMDSVTYGVISGLNRVVSADSGIELIQTDAAINPGNSGGALVNTKGELVGINSSKIVAAEYEGMGFAIPSNTVVEICNNIISRENAPEPYIGISISERYTKEVLKYYGYPAGAVVLSVADGSPADKAGIERGDILTEFDGNEIPEYTVLEDLIRESEAGKTVPVKIYRSGKYYTTDITISSNNSLN